MACRREILVTAIVIVYTIVMAGELDGRELRPSNHGLDNQESPPAGEKSPPDMLSFFGGGGGGGNGGKETTPALPKSFNSSDTLSWDERYDGNGRSKDHVREVLLVASLVCGITGVILLLVSALLYIFRYRKHKSLPSSSSNDNPK